MNWKEKMPGQSQHSSGSLEYNAGKFCGEQANSPEANTWQLIKRKKDFGDLEMV